MPPLIRGLMKPDAYDHATAAMQLLETHISWVILTGEYAYKLKKPVDLGFVDFTTLAKRQHFCDEEIRLNRRLAAELYLGVRPIFGSEDQPTFHGAGEPIEYAVQMRQFDQVLLLPAVLNRGELRPDHIDRLAIVLAEFHDRSAAASGASPYGAPDAVRAPVEANFAALSSNLLSAEQTAALRRLQQWNEAEFHRLRDWFQQRRDAGRVRECHGDLHLGNMVLLNDEIAPFDCLEFNPGLRWIDVISEIAFLVMDLQERGRRDLAFRVLNRWLQHSGDYDGLTGWRWYFAYRAMVRAKVAALRLQQPELAEDEIQVKRDELAQYIALAARSIQPRPTPLILMHGVSGSGKSHVASWLAERFGAIQARSDVERKRLFGAWGLSPSNPAIGDMYAAEVTQRLYREILAGIAQTVRAAGFPVIIDATHLKRWQRDVFWELATRLGAACLILDVQASVETMRRRLRDRQAAGGDPSDADASIMDRQLANREPFTAGELARTIVVDTEASDWSDRLMSELSGQIQP